MKMTYSKNNTRTQAPGCDFTERKRHSTKSNGVEDIIEYIRAKRTMRSRICHTAKRFGIADTARALGVNYNHVYNVVNNAREISPTLQQAMIDLDLWYRQPASRRRYARDIPRHFTDRQRDEFIKRMDAAYEATVDYMRGKDG
jgi:hypothetical protein